MVFGFGKKRKEREEEAAQDEVEYVLFKGALNGVEPNLAENARLAQAGLGPAKEIVTDALLRGAEMFRIDPKGNVAVVTISIDGLAYPGSRLSRQQGLAVTQMIKLLAGLDIRERRRKQQGGVKAEFEGTSYELRVDSVPTEDGAERLSVRAVDPKKLLENPEELGFPDELKRKIREYTSEKNGVIVACGPPRSGTTSTLIGVIRSVDGYLYTVVNIADLGGRELSHVNNLELGPDDDLQTTLDRSIRVESDVIVVPPLGDEGTAKTVFAMHSRVALLTEMVARDSAHAIAQLAAWVGDPGQVAEGLKLVVGQKLIRLLCDSCKQAYRPHATMMAKVGIPPETNILYRATQWSQSSSDQMGSAEVEPCDKCGGLGYRGRTGLFELIELTEPVRAAVAKGASADEIRTLARNEKMLTFRAEGVRLVAEGRTSLEELQRVFKSA